MKSRYFLFVLSFCILTSSAHAQQAVLSLDDCLKIALSESPTVKVADLDVSRVDYSKKEVLADLLPQVSFGGSYNRMLAKQVAYMNMDSFKGMGGAGAGDSQPSDTETSTASKSKDTGIKMGLDNSYSVGFQAAVPIIAPQLWASLKLSDAQILQSLEQARASRLELINQVKGAYYTLLLAKDSKSVIQQSYDMAAFTHDLYSKRFSVGDASEYDVLRTSVAMKNVEPELLQADIAIKQAHLQLMLLMGVDASLDFDIAGRLADYEKTMYEDVLKLPTDFSQNSSLVMNALQIQTLEKSVKVNKMAWLPNLSFNINYNWTSSSDGSPFKNFRWNPYSVVGLTLSIPIFTGGKTYSRVKQAEVQVTQMQLQRDNLIRSVKMQVDLAVDNINLNVRQIASCSESVGQAERAHKIQQESFDIGATSYLDLRDAELALTRSRLTYYQAIYNYLVATNDLELLLGNADTAIYNTSSTSSQH